MKNTVKVLEPKTCRFRNKKQKCNPHVLLFSLSPISIYTYTDALRRKCKFVHQTLLYGNEFNNSYNCHHNLSFHVTVTLFLFKTPEKEYFLFKLKGQFI